MPQLKFNKILSFSSEDSNFPADNLLKSDAFCKWKCGKESVGKKASVTVQLENLSQINSIDIGNEHSAIIEVLAGREDKDFQPLLVASSFMTPLESRNSTNTSRVRMFSEDKLHKGAGSEKWDRIKIVCNQPFNKNVQYGLSFIKVHSHTRAETSSKVEKLGMFKLREKDENDDGGLQIGSFFAKRKQTETAPLKGAAAIRAASNECVTPEPHKRKAEDDDQNQFYQLKKKQTKESTNAWGSEGSPKANKNSNIVNNKSKDKEQIKEATEIKDKDNQVTTNIKKGGTTTMSTTIEQPFTSTNNQTSVTTSTKHCKSRPFASLMNDVSFVLSGYQNPQRSQLREKMTKMGAKYHSDWMKNSTHLVCAFANTPKFQAVQGKGKIVTGSWVEECYNKKIRLPWRRYNLEKTKGDESEEEIYACEILPPEDNKQNKQEPAPSSDSDDEDTDDEIQRVMHEDKKKQNKKGNVKQTKVEVKDKGKQMNGKYLSEKDGSNNGKDDDEVHDANTEDDAYDADTDVESDELTKENGKENQKNQLQQRIDTSTLALPDLSNHFKGKVFFLLITKDKTPTSLINRYIVAFGGRVVLYMNEHVNYIITDKDFDKEAKEAQEDHPGVHILRPQWIFECNDAASLVSHQPYLIIPGGN